MRLRWEICVTIASLALPMVCAAQNVPPVQPGTNPQTKPGGTIVVNPTEEECKRGWSAGMRWTREQFQEFCARLGSSK